MKCKIIVFICLSFLLFTKINLTAQEKSVKVAAASNLSYVLEELKDDFNKTNNEIKLEITYGASGKLSSQIQQNAPFDIFMSADMEFPKKIVKAGFAENEPAVYAKGKLIIFSVKQFDLKKGLKILNDKNIKTISISNPDSTPYGAAAVESLKNYKIFKNIESKFVFTETISQVIQQVITASDIGITAKSLVYSKEMSNYKEGINWAEIDPKLYKKIEQGMVILKNGIQKPEVNIFYDYIFSERAKDIFIKYGYEF